MGTTEVRMRRAKSTRFRSVLGRSIFRLLYSVFLLFSLFPPSVLAHARSTSYSVWEIEENQVQVTVRVPVIELQRSLVFPATSLSNLRSLDGETERALAAYLTSHLRLFSGDQLCQPVPPGVRPVPSNALTHITRSWTLVCPAPRQLRLHNTAFFASAPAHLHFARIRIPGTSAVEKVFSVHEREWVFFLSESAAQESGSRFLDYLRLGVSHILSGIDHLVFLLALLLMAESLASIAQIVTGFTVAHSITLALGVLNVVRPASTAVESLIGFSIGIVAVENFFLTTGEATRRRLLRSVGVSLIASVAAAGLGLLHVPLPALVGMSIFAMAYLLLLHDRPGRHPLRWFVAFVFGLIHGFGFAGTLQEMALPANRMATALLGFNLGVELGQLGAVVLLWPLLMRLRRLQGRQTHILTIQTGSAVLLAVGIFWFVTRAAVRL